MPPTRRRGPAPSRPEPAPWTYTFEDIESWEGAAPGPCYVTILLEGERADTIRKQLDALPFGFSRGTRRHNPPLPLIPPRDAAHDLAKDVAGHALDAYYEARDLARAAYARYEASEDNRRHDAVREAGEQDDGLFDACNKWQMWCDVALVGEAHARDHLMHVVLQSAQMDERLLQLKDLPDDWGPAALAIGNDLVIVVPEDTGDVAGPYRPLLAIVEPARFHSDEDLHD